MEKDYVIPGEKNYRDEDFDVKARNDEFDRVQAQIELAMDPPINYKGERVHNSDILKMLPDLLENLKTPPIFIQKTDYKAKYEELQKAYIKQIDQTQDVIDKYMALADKYSDLVDKYTELKKG